MNTQKTKPDFSFHKTPVVTEDVVAEAEMISASLSIQGNLSLDDDMDLGCDPYNTTGQHVVLRQKYRQR